MSEEVIIIDPVVIILSLVGGQKKESPGSPRADHGIECHKTAPPTVDRENQLVCSVPLLRHIAHTLLVSSKLSARPSVSHSANLGDEIVPPVFSCPPFSFYHS